MDGLVATADGTRRVATKFHAAAKGHSTIGRGRAHIELTGVAAKTSKTAPTDKSSQEKKEVKCLVSLLTRKPPPPKRKKSFCVFREYFCCSFLPRSNQAAVRDGAPPRPPLDKFWETMWP